VSLTDFAGRSRGTATRQDARFLFLWELLSLFFWEAWHIFRKWKQLLWMLYE